MRSENKRIFFLFFMFVFALIPLITTAKADSNVEVYMPYEQFSLIKASEPIIPDYPFSDDYPFLEDDDAVMKYNEWWNAKYKQQTTTLPNLDKIQSFTKKSTEIVFANVLESNVLYSPLNTWFYLELLSNLTEGNSRHQILEAMGVDAESTSYNAKDTLYNAIFWDDGCSVLHPASSIWIDKSINLSDELAKELAMNHHTSSFQGTMSEEKYDEAFRSWLNEKTNSLMKDIVNDLRFDPSINVSLCTSLYLRCPWSLPFNRDETCQDVFYSSDGDVTMDFMSKEESGGTVYQGDGFSSVIMDLQDGGFVTLVLPDLGRDLKDLLQTDALYDFLFTGRSWDNVKNGKIKVTMPKVDILTATPLEQTLNHLGVIDVFDSQKAKFTVDISSDDVISLSSVDQYSRLIMNEDGIEAASIIVSDGASLRIPSEEEIEFILNRPFMFMVFSESNIPLFVGAFNSPVC